MMGEGYQLPIDTGWAWVICFASFICMLMASMSLQVLSVLFLELVNEFNTSVTTTSLSVMSFIMSTSISSLVSINILIPRFQERRVIVSAGVFFSIFSTLLSVAPNVWVFISLTACQGISIGCIYVPAISLTSYYFKKHRSLAITICVSGISVSMIAGPPVIRLIMSHFDLRGTLLIMAGIQTNILVGGCLMRPLLAYKRKNITRDNDHVSQKDQTKESLVNFSQNDFDHEELYEQTSPAEADVGHAVKTKMPPKDGGVSDTKNSLLAEEKYSHHSDDNLRKDPLTDSFQTESLDDNAMSLLSGRPASLIRQLSTPEEDTGGNKNLTTRKQQHVYQRSNSCVESGKVSVGHTGLTGGPDMASVWSVSCGQVVAEATAVGILGSSQHLKGHHASETHGAQDCSSWWLCTVVRTIFDPILFRPLAFRAVLILMYPATTVVYILQYIPTITVIQGATKEQGAILLTITGAVDLASRLAVGLLADTKLLTPSQMIGIAHVCLGILCHFGVLFTNFNNLIGWSVAMGLFIGTRQSLLPMLLIEVVGVPNMARSLSIVVMIGTLLQASHSPILSAVFEATGNFTVVLHLCGACQLIAGVGHLLLCLITRIDRRRQEMEQGEELSGGGHE